MSLNIFMRDNVEEFMRTIKRSSPEDGQMVEEDEEADDDWLSKPAPNADEQMIQEDEYAQENRYSYIVKPSLPINAEIRNIEEPLLLALERTHHRRVLPRQKLSANHM